MRAVRVEGGLWFSHREGITRGTCLASRPCAPAFRATNGPTNCFFGLDIWFGQPRTGALQGVATTVLDPGTENMVPIGLGEKISAEFPKTPKFFPRSARSPGPLGPAGRRLGQHMCAHSEGPRHSLNGGSLQIFPVFPRAAAIDQ